MASSNQLTARAMNQLSKSVPRVHSRPYHRLLQDTTHPHRLMQGFNASHSSFHTSTPSPSPSIDSLTIPQSFLPSIPSSTDIHRIPLLPTNSFTAHAEAAADDAVPKPEIHTLSADGTHIASPSFMSNEKDGHHGVVEGFDVKGSVEKGVKEGIGMVEREVGVVRELWEGVLDDVLGKKKVGGL